MMTTIIMIKLQVLMICQFTLSIPYVTMLLAIKRKEITTWLKTKN